jgi:hypothetical protein
MNSLAPKTAHIRTHLPRVLLIPALVIALSTLGCFQQPQPELPLIINECRLAPSPTPKSLYDTTDWVELYNCGDTAVNLSQFSLSDNSAYPSRFVFEDSLVQAGGYYVVLCKERNDTMRNVSGFSFSTDRQQRESIVLSRLSGELIDIIDIAKLIEQTGDKQRSLGRAIDRSARWIAQDAPSPGGANHGQ